MRDAMGMERGRTDPLIVRWSFFRGAWKRPNEKHSWQQPQLITHYLSRRPLRRCADAPTPDLECPPFSPCNGFRSTMSLFHRRSASLAHPPSIGLAVLLSNTSGPSSRGLSLSPPTVSVSSPLEATNPLEQDCRDKSAFSRRRAHLRQTTCDRRPGGKNLTNSPVPVAWKRKGARPEGRRLRGMPCSTPLADEFRLAEG